MAENGALEGAGQGYLAQKLSYVRNEHHPRMPIRPRTQISSFLSCKFRRIHADVADRPMHKEPESADYTIRIVERLHVVYTRRTQAVFASPSLLRVFVRQAVA